MYNLYKNNQTNEVVGVLKNQNMAIPFAPDNTDYQQFKKDLAAGVELEDATGTVMTSAQIATFVATLP